MVEAIDDALRELSEQLALIAQKVGNLAAPTGGTRPGPISTNSAPLPELRSPSDKAQLARSIYSLRRQRASILGDHELFSEPAWDILLDLYIAMNERKSISVSSACIGSGAPPTTGLRWLGVLEVKGLVERRHDPSDQRRVLVHLSATGIAAMDEFFDRALDALAD